MKEQELEVVNSTLKSAIEEASWVRAIIGIAIGLIIAGLVGYKLASDNIVVIPLEQGIKT